MSLSIAGYQVLVERTTSISSGEGAGSDQKDRMPTGVFSNKKSYVSVATNMEMKV